MSRRRPLLGCGASTVPPVGAVVAPKPFIDPAKDQPKADVAALAGEAAAGG